MDRSQHSPDRVDEHADSPKSIASSPDSAKREKLVEDDEEIEEYTLPVRVRLPFLMERFSLTEKDAEIVRQTIVSLRAKRLITDGLRVSKIFNGHDARIVDLLKSLPIFRVFLGLSKKSNKQVYKVVLKNPEKEKDRVAASKTSFADISSGDEADNDELGKILQQTCKNVLPWTFKSGGSNHLWNDT